MASAGRLNAADEPPVGAEELARLTVVSARLMGQAKAIESLGCYGFAKSGHCLLGASIAPQESVTIRIPLEAGREHFWFAAADVNAKDLDIQVAGPSGSTVAKDVSNDPVPCVVFTAKESGEHRVTLTLFKGTSTSFCALVMMERTGCAGVVVGRACLGRPWFFGQLADVFAGLPARPEPPLGEVAVIAAEHARLLAESVGERRAMLMMRKHLGWYLTGYAVGSVARRQLTLVASFTELDDQLAALDHSLIVDATTAARPRGTQTGPHAVIIPDGWLDAEATTPPDALADASVSGG